MKLDQRLLRIALANRLPLFLTIGMGFAAGALTILQARYLSRVIDRVFLGKETLEQVMGLLEILLVIILLRALLTWGSEIAANALARRAKTGLRARLLRRLFSLGPAYVRRERTGELVSVAIEGTEALDAYFSQYLPGLALAALVPLTILFFVFPLDPLSGAVLLLTAPLIPIFMVLIGSLAQTLTRRQWLSLRRMSAYFLDVLQGLTTLKILGRSRAQIDVIAEVSDRFRRVTMGVLQVAFLSGLTLELVATLSTAVVAVEIGLRLLYGRLAFEQAFFVLLLAPEFYLPLRMLGTRFHAGMAGVEAAKRIFEVLEMAGNRQLPDTDLEKTDADGAAGVLGVIALEDVHFTYDGDRHALQGVTLQIPPGQKVVLVGPSGSGKSTIASLLLRFIEPGQGKITVNGRPLREFPLEEWSAQIAYVPQNPYLFHDTVAANIRLARPQASLEQVVWAAQQAAAAEFIQALPDGYQTLVGERGVRLSGGQAQRIALARAFLKDAPFVVLDEPAASLDPEHEARLQAAMNRLLQGKSALVIAHRLNAARQADQIIVLDQGQVVESGAHAALAQRGGLYQRLVSAHAGASTPQRPYPASPLPSYPTPQLPASLTPVRETVPAFSPGSLLPNLLHTLLRLLRLAWPFKWLVGLSVLLGTATVLSGVGLMATSAYIISAAALQPSIAKLQVAIVGVRFFGLTRGIFRYLERCLSHQVTFRLLARLRTWFYQALEPLAPARLMGYRSGDLLARLHGDIESLENFYVRAIAPPLAAVLVAAAVGLFIARFDPRLTMIFLSFLVAAGVGVPLLAGWLGRWVAPQMVTHRAALNAAIVDSLQGLPDLAACNQLAPQARRIDAISQALSNAQKWMAGIQGMQTALLGLLANLGMWVVLFSSILLVQSGRMDGVYLAVIILAVLSSFETVIPLPQAAQYLQGNLLAARRLFEVVDTQPEVSDPPIPRPLPAEFNLQVKDLRFRYPPSMDSSSFAESDQPYALDGLSFSLSQGKRLAIVGPSGAGKSTLLSLLLRFWEVEQGQILLGGHDLRQYAQEDLRRSMGVVAQRTDLFNASLRDNLRIARPNATQAEIVQAAESAQLHGLIQSLPQGYDTWIGEQGLRLSGGERQRLAIARALLKDPALLILDEATANLDALTERQVLESINVLMQGRTTLMITHRLVGLEAMDEIIVLDAGRVVERGRHAELLAMGGLYRRMWNLQNQVLLA